MHFIQSSVKTQNQMCCMLKLESCVVSLVILAAHKLHLITFVIQTVGIMFVNDVN